MKIKEANLFLERLKNGQNISEKEDPEILALLLDLKLVEVYNQKVLLTPQGNLATGMGLQAYLKYQETEKEILAFSLENSRRKRKLLIFAFLLLLISFIVALYTNLSF